MRAFKWAAPLGGLLIASCGQQEPVEQSAEHAVSAPIAEEKQPVKEVEVSLLSTSDKGRLCRAVIANLNGRDPGIIKMISSEGDLVRVRYTRDDGTVWTNECAITNSGVVKWRMVDNGQVGRWRDEDTFEHSINGSEVRVQSFMFGEAVSDKTYQID